MEKFYFYKVTNLINDKFYYGSGSKEYYVGSGKILLKAYDTYGIENFKFERLKYFKSRIDAYNFEDRFLKLYKISSLRSSYNMKDNGLGGDSFTFNPNKEIIREKHRIRGKSIPMSESCRLAANEWRYKNHCMYGSEISEDIKIENRKKHSETVKKWINDNGHPFQDKHHTEETKKKISDSKSKENHHMWGKHVTELTKDKIRESIILSKNPFLIKVVDIDSGQEFLANSMTEACNYVKGSASYIKKCLIKIRPSYKNYTFEYVDR